MTDPTVSTPAAPVERARPVSLFTTVFLLALFAVFFFVVRYFYSPVRSAPQHDMPQNLGKEMEWRATRASRQATLTELRQTHAKEATSYGWADQDAGLVRLPIERAMELTVQQYGKKGSNERGGGATAPRKR